MDLDEIRIRFGFVFQREAGSPMGFVADHQVKIRQIPGPLRFNDDINGLVRRKDHFPTVVSGFLNSVGQPIRTRGRGVGEFCCSHILVFLPDLAIRTDHKGIKRLLGLICPFPKGLGYQSDRRGQKQRQPVIRDHTLHDVKTGKGLAGTTGHNELAAILGFKALQGRL